MRSLFIVAVVVLLVQSCKPNYKPLPEKEMVSLLLDVNIAESYSSILKDSLHRAGMKNIDSLSVYYKDIFAHHKITPDQFTQSLEWYKSHPDELDSLSAKILLKAIALKSFIPK
jgi:hypothetical protein